MDPSVRDDGDPEPDLQLASDSAVDDAKAEDSVRQRPSGDGVQSVRERLVARAQGARRDGELEGPVRGGLEEIGRVEERNALGGELDALGAPTGRAPSAPLGARHPNQLSPTLIAIFGTLIGVATVVSIIALMINIDRHKLAELPKPTPVESASVALAPAVEAPPVPKRVRQKVPGPWRIADAKGDSKTHTIEGKVGTDPFIKALTGAGLEEKEAYRLLTAMKGVRDFDKCAKTDRFTALIERGTSRLKAFEYTVGPEEVYQAREGDDGLLKGAKLDLKVEHNQVSGALVYDGHNFDASAEHAGFDNGLGHVVALALQGHMSMDELERGDTIRLIGQEVTVLGEFARYTGIEAIEVRHADPKKETLRVYYFDDPTLRGYYDASGKSPFEGGWRKPIPGAPITSPFNPKRMHPILHKIMPHLGTDIGAPMGTPVGASAPGTVSYVGPGGPAGNLLKIMHPNGIETGYAHLSRYVEGIKVGDKVKRMQTIGYVGSTGRSTGPHLHFSAERDGKFFDAETLNLDGMRVLSQEQREQFTAVVAKYNPLLDAIVLPPPLPSIATSTGSVAGVAAPVGSGATEDPGLAEPAELDEPSAKPEASGSAATPAPGKASSVYMSDKELLKAQSATDEGEVSE
ncbi:MAG TPA: M23 family metallopeptidase [Polyangiaceae bacterium]|nr:M23 family metallopeptidase [Polyangiaceae bacterium]